MIEMPMRAATALIADDEPLLREHLQAHLARLWPQCQVVAQARNGREAVQLYEQHHPDVVFLDVHMPGMNGVEAARQIGRDALLVFVTAYDSYAVQAFEEGAVDYLVKPFEAERLADTVQRLALRLEGRQVAAAADAATADSQAGDQSAPPASLDDVLARLAAKLQRQAGSGPWLQWIKASVGQAVRLIPVDEVTYLRSDEKYTLVVWSGGEALIRKPIRELVDELDPEQFAQIHRSVIVNLCHVTQVTRGANETADVHLRGRSETLPVSRSYLHLFRQM
jgi:DNA-binding LytR/AlgR family response regulator